MSDILLATKIHIPPLHRTLVSRPHLIRQLNDGIAQNHRLTLISAPAGYGKSTLLGDWVSQTEIPVAWLSLEKGENNPARFWNYFISALSTIPHLRQAGIREKILQLLQSQQSPPMDLPLTNLLNDISELEEDAVLVLDDLHSVTAGQIHQDLIFLIDHLPRTENGLHLVVASRMDPPWPLARWRVRNELTELRSADLRFSYEEVFQFLNLILQLELSSQDVAALQERTEGWIAGLQMAAVSMRARLKAQGSQGVSHFIESFTGSNRFILDYLIEEVISQQPAEIQDFLQETSILEQLTAPLCDALLDREDSQAILDQIEQANLFLSPLDEERQWYRYHQLFAELLRKRLNQSKPDHITDLHRRASNWYAENCCLSEAISHALDAGDILRVNDFVSGNALVMVEHAELLDVLRHFEEMPDQHISSKPWLCVGYAWVKAYIDPSEEVDRILKQAEKGLTGIEDAFEKQRITSHMAAIRAYAAWVKGEADKALVFARDALENLPEDDWMTRSHILNIEGLALEYNFDLDGAVQSFEAAIAAGQKTCRSYEIFQAYANLAYAKYTQGRLHQAFSLCQKVLYLAEQSNQISIRMPVLAYAYATMSLVQYEWNEVEPALSNARHAVNLAAQWNQADALHFALTCLCKALCAAGDLEEAHAVNHRSMQLAINVSPWYIRISAYDEIMLNLIKEDIPAAAQGIAKLEQLVGEMAKKGWFLIAKTSLLYAQGCFSDVIVFSEDAIEYVNRWGAYCFLLNILPFQAIALHALGKEVEAMEAIRRCLALAAPERFVRIFVERGAPMVELLQIALSQGIETEYINHLLPAFGLPTISHKPDEPTSLKTKPKYHAAPLFEPLSERELQVLRFLDSALTSEEISRELYVSVSTIRTHIRNIYRKLDVHGRIEAIQKAEDLALI